MKYAVLGYDSEGSLDSLARTSGPSTPTIVPSTTTFRRWMRRSFAGAFVALAAKLATSER